MQYKGCHCNNKQYYHCELFLVAGELKTSVSSVNQVSEKSQVIRSNTSIGFH